jgi:hypothetical protein
MSGRMAIVGCGVLRSVRYATEAGTWQKEFNAGRKVEVLRFPSSINCERFGVGVMLKTFENPTHIMTDMFESER